MRAFDLRNKLIKDYSDYVQSFINIRDNRIREKVNEEMEAGLLWPDPLIQVNPSFEPGESIEEFVRQNILHDECLRIFQKDKDEKGKRE